MIVEVARFLKSRNRELSFLPPVCVIRNWESKNNSFFILFTIPLIPILVPIPPKCAKESESRFLGIGMVPPLIHLSWKNFAEANERFGEYDGWHSAEINSRQGFALPDLFLSTSSSSLFCLWWLVSLFSSHFSRFGFSIVYKLTNRRRWRRLAHWHAVSHVPWPWDSPSLVTNSRRLVWMWNLSEFEENLHQDELSKAFIDWCTQPPQKLQRAPRQVSLWWY